jgi:hypothetical protein
MITAVVPTAAPTSQRSRGATRWRTANAISSPSTNAHSPTMPIRVRR